MEEQPDRRGYRQHSKAYSNARDSMLLRTHAIAQWHIVRTDDKRSARWYLNATSCRSCTTPAGKIWSSNRTPQFAFEFTPDRIGSRHLARGLHPKQDHMKTSDIEVHDMLSVFSVDEVEKRIGEVPGVQSATVNFAAGKATVRYDETQLEATDIKSAVRQRGHDTTEPAGTSPGEGHAGHAPPGAQSEASSSAAPTSAPGAPTAEGLADAEPPDKAAPSPTLDAPPAASAAAPAGDAHPDKAGGGKS
ncbi:MAG: cation transporter [Gammaproteobacteria bacterium]